MAHTNTATTPRAKRAPKPISATPPLQARLKPYDPAQGHVRRGLSIVCLGMHFDEGVIVSGVTEDEADILRPIRQRDDDPKSPLAFDILPQPEMERLVRREQKDKLGLTPKAIEAIREAIGADDAGALIAPSGPPPRDAAYMRRAAGRNVSDARPARRIRV
jgi:hypothetical protein